MTDASWAWQVASRAALLADTVLMEDVTGVHDRVPEGSSFPYVTTGETVEQPDNAHDSTGSELSSTFHVWSNYAGWNEGKRAAGRIRRVLEHADLELVDWRLVGCYFAETVTVPDPNPELRHLVVRFRVLLERTT